jgi:hypothetical protein
MIKTRLAAALSLALLVAPVSQAARYRVVELPVVNEGQDSFPSAINEDGDITINVTSPYNIPIDLELLDFESDTLQNGLIDAQSASNGNFNSVDYQILLAFIRNGDGLQFAQQIASSISFIASENETNFIPGFDQRTAEDNEFPFSTSTSLRDINNSGFAVGTGEGYFEKIEYSFDSGQDTIFIVQEFGNRGFVSFGNTIVGLPAPEIVAGGFSEAFGINESNQVVGYGSTLFLTEALELGETSCEDEEARGDIPFESCIDSLVSTFTESPTTYARLRGLIWQLDDAGNLIDTKELGLVFEPDADDFTNYSSQAVAINDNGIAVGSSNGQYIERGITQIRNFGVIFNGDEVINLTPDPDTTVARSSTTISSAADINNNNLVVGFEIKAINGALRDKFFVYDMNLGQITFPDDFFLGSESRALDINNNGLVVGYGEADASLTGRRSEGFLYDHNTEEFNGINSLISCNSPYSIVQANSINDENEIVATALYQDAARDERGELILDSSGSEVLIDYVAAVKLTPIEGGEIDNCEETVDLLNRERQGASITWLLSFGLIALVYRRFKKHL